MTDDPIVSEVRRLRDEHAKSFGYDLRRIFADLKRSEEHRDTGKSPMLEAPERDEARRTTDLNKVRFAGR